MLTYSLKDPAEIIFYGLNFASLLAANETIVAATVACSVVNGIDANASQMPTGAVQINGTVVASLVGGGVHGVSYKLMFTVDTSTGQKLKDYGVFDVRKQ